LSERKRILVADDDAEMRAALQLTLKKGGHDAVMAKDGQEALEMLSRERFDLLVTDLRMPRLGGIELLERLEAAAPHTPALVITAHGTVDTAVESMKRGAVDFLQKPFGPDLLLAKIAQALSRVLPGTDRRELQNTLVAHDRAMDETLEMIDAAAVSRATVLITGESGTGKEVVARAIHRLGPWADQPFVAVNCAAIPTNLMESELFGHEKGAFTGAVENRAGRFEQAQGGTILLDEVSEMEPALQAKLLRVLQEREVERVGGSRIIKLDVRVIATTNRDLNEEIRKGRFREDLYWRLHVIPIALPPLRKRPADVALLADHFLAAASPPGSQAAFDAESRKALAAHSWPGNVRELQNTVERALVLSRGRTIEQRHLRLALPAAQEGQGLKISGTLEEMERQLILAAFEENGGNKKATARALGINIKTLRARLKGYGVGAEEEDDEEE